MQDAAQAKRPTLLPLIRYRDPERAVDWLGKAFGLKTCCVAKRADGSFAYAQLAHDDNLIMVTPFRETGAPLDQPAGSGKRAAQGCYFVVENVETHFARAKDAGAKVVLDIKPYEHGGSRYSCRDLEGHVWTFGTFDPWKNKALASPARLQMLSARKRRASLAAAAALTVVALAVPAWRLQTMPRAPVAAAPAESAGTQPRETVAQVDASAREALQRTRDELSAARAARDAAEASQRTALTELAQERAARQDAERLKTEPFPSPPARAAAEEIVRDLGDHLTRNAQAAHAAGSGPAPAQSSLEAPAPVAAISDAPPAPGPTPGASPPSPAPSNPQLAEGQAAMAQGDIEAARRHFARLAEQGVPAAALALGSTYDPVGIERAGVASAQADRVRAKQWYRRAIELAQAAAERHAPK